MSSTPDLLTTPYTPPDVPDPFLVDSDDEKDNDDVADIQPNVNKDVPEPPSEDEDDMPDIYLPGLVLPTMFLPIPNADPLTTLLVKYISPAARPHRDVSGDWQHTDHHTLIMSHSWRALAHMARDRILSSPPDDIVLLFSLWYLRLASLARLRLFNQTAAECTNLFSVLNSVSPEILDRFLPFELGVIHVRLKYWAGDYMGYLDALTALLRKCKLRARENHTDTDMWKERGARICLIIASQLVEMKDYGAATHLLEPLASTSPAMSSAIARIYLQSGCISQAAKFVPNTDMNRALIAAASGDWEIAEQALRNIIAAEEEDYVAINNLAVTLLNQGRLKDAIDLLENALRTSPSSVVVAEPFLFNLSTLYELRSSSSTEKKNALLVEVAKWCGDGLSTACLKMPTS